MARKKESVESVMVGYFQTADLVAAVTMFHVIDMVLSARKKREGFEQAPANPASRRPGRPKKVATPPTGD